MEFSIDRTGEDSALIAPDLAHGLVIIRLGELSQAVGIEPYAARHLAGMLTHAADLVDAQRKAGAN